MRERSLLDTREGNARNNRYGSAIEDVVAVQHTYLEGLVNSVVGSNDVQLGILRIEGI